MQDLESAKCPYCQRTWYAAKSHDPLKFHLDYCEANPENDYTAGEVMNFNIAGKVLRTDVTYATDLVTGMVFELPDKPEITAVVIDHETDVHGADVNYMTLYSPSHPGYCGKIRFGYMDTVMTHRVDVE